MGVKMVHHNIAAVLNVIVANIRPISMQQASHAINVTHYVMMDAHQTLTPHA